MPDVMDGHIQKEKLRHVLFDEFKIGIAAQVHNVGHGTGHKVINGNDLVAACEQKIHQMRPEETGATSDDRGWLSGHWEPFSFYGHKSGGDHTRWKLC